jgi:hypothetical protein
MTDKPDFFSLEDRCRLVDHSGFAVRDHFYSESGDIWNAIWQRQDGESLVSSLGWSCFDIITVLYRDLKGVSSNQVRVILEILGGRIVRLNL